VAGCCECGDEPSGSGATELVITVDADAITIKESDIYQLFLRKNKSNIKQRVCLLALLLISIESGFSDSCGFTKDLFTQSDC
jgi:hypothetical protein